MTIVDQIQFNFIKAIEYKWCEAVICDQLSKIYVYRTLFLSTTFREAVTPVIHILNRIYLLFEYELMYKIIYYTCI